MKSHYFSSLMKNNSNSVAFSFNTLKISLYPLLDCMVYDEKSDDELLSSSHSLTNFLQDFLFVFIFLQGEYDMPRVFAFLILFHVFWATYICDLLSVINFWRLLTIISSNISFAPFSFFLYWYSSYTYIYYIYIIYVCVCYTFGYHPTVLGSSVLFLSLYFFFILHLRNFYIHLSSTSLILSSAELHLLWAHQRHSSLLLLYFLFLSFIF